MKKIISYFMSFFLLCTVLNINFVTLAYDNSSDCFEKHEQYVVESSGVDCISDIIVSAPILVGINESGENIYRKNVELKNDFFRTKRNKYISQNVLNFCFEYSKSGVKLSEDGLKKEENITKSNTWKTSSSEEIFTSPEQCIVSRHVGIYKKASIWEDLGHFEEFHIDVICSVDGEVTCNLKSEESAEKKDTIVSEVIVKREKLKDNIIRETTIKDKKSISDSKLSTNDIYKYITREIHVAYTTEAGQLLDEAVIEATFRYNTKTREAQCLSTSNKEKNDKVAVTMRTGNETRAYGGAYGEIKLKYPFGAITKSLDEVLIIKCDCSGNIISQFFT